MIHMTNGQGGTLCGLNMQQAGIISNEAMTITCPDCIRLMPHHVEPLVKHYPADAVSHSDAVKVVADK
jgi:hypothetical protein